MRQSASTIGKWAAIGLLPAFTVVWALAPGDPVTVPVEVGFEASEGYGAGPLPAASAWLVDGDIEVVDTDAATGTQGVRLNPGQTAARLRLNTLAHAEGEIVWVDLKIKAVASAPGALPETLTGDTSAAVGLVEVSATEAEVYAVDGNGQGGGEWVATGVRVPIADGVATQWLRLSYRLDYIRKTWDVYVGGTLRFADFGFVIDTLETFGQFSLRGDRERAVLLDDLYIGIGSPLFADADRDGIDDAYEVAHGMDAAIDDRQGDVDRDGLSNLTELVLGAQVDDPDTDSDGMPDGVESANGTNPLVADDFGASELPFQEDFESTAVGDFAGQNGWLVPAGSQAVVQSGEVSGGSRALEFSGGDEALVVKHIKGSGHPVVWVDLHLQPAFRDAAAPAQLGEGVAAGFLFDPDGYLHVFDGTTGQWRALPEEPRPANLAPVESGAWSRLTVQLDYASQQWSVWLNGVRAASDLGFAHSSPCFWRLALSSAGIGRIDDIAVAADQPDGLVEPLGDTEPPTVPSGLATDAVGENAVRLGWEPSGDNVGIQLYRVYRDGTLLGETSGTSYTDSTVAPGTSYSYAVVAVDTWENESTVSESLAVATPTLQRLGTGLAGSYFDRLYFEEPALERVDAQVAFEWPVGVAPDPALHHETFAVRWTGLLEPGFTGTHTLRIVANDGVRLWVDGELAIDHWAHAGTTTRTAEVDLVAGRPTPVVLEYFESTGTAKVHLQWQPPLADQAVAIPSELLYPAPTATDTVAPDVPQGLHAAEAGDNDILLAWDQPADDVAVAAYRVFRDGAEIARVPVPQWRDGGLDPAQAYAYSVQAEDFAGNLSVASGILETATVAGTLPEPWRHRDVGSSPTTRGSAGYDAGTGKFAVSGAGRDIFGSMPTDQPDEFHFVYRKVQGDFVITARLDSFEAVENYAKAGVMIRDGLGGYDRHFMTAVSHGEHAQLLARTAPGTSTWNSDVSVLPTPYWVRATRVGDSFVGAYSADGVQWQTVTSLVIPMGEEVYVGMAVCGHDDTQPAPAVFSQVTVSDDVASAGVSGASGGPDFDGDGISDWEEIEVYGTDPTVQDIWIGDTVAALTGSQGTGTFGSWRVEGDTLVSETVKAAVDYTVQIAEPGVYRIEFELAAGQNETTNYIYPVTVSIDGHLLERFDVYLSGEGSALIHAATPWLEPGTHTIQLHYDNTYSYRSLRVIALRVQSLVGLDADENGVADWMEGRLDDLNGLEGDGGSLVSPACLEGGSRYGAFSEIVVGGETVTVNPAPGFGWYVDVPLDAEAPVPVAASFENGGRVESLDLVWTPLNLIADAPEPEAEPLRIRKGDSLLLAAHPETATGGSAVVTVDGPIPAPVEYQIADALADRQPHLFEVPGTYTVGAVFTDASGSVAAEPTIVEVVEAQFSGDVATSAYQPVVWDNPLIPDTVLVEHDQGIQFAATEPLPEGGLRFRVASANPGESHVVARLGEDGPIADHAAVRSVEVSSDVQTSVDLLEVYADGSRLIGTPLILSDITADTRVEIEIFVAGVTFEDGSVFKVLTAADFDEYGRTYLKFIKSGTAPSSICHRIHVYEGDTYLGTF